MEMIEGNESKRDYAEVNCPRIDKGIENLGYCLSQCTSPQILGWGHPSGKAWQVEMSLSMLLNLLHIGNLHPLKKLKHFLVIFTQFFIWLISSKPPSPWVDSILTTVFILIRAGPKRIISDLLILYGSFIPLYKKAN